MFSEVKVGEIRKNKDKLTRIGIRNKNEATALD